MASSEFQNLTRNLNYQSLEILETLRTLRLNFPINELTESEWKILESMADWGKRIPFDRVVTWRFCERVEFCSENQVHLLVIRYLEIDPFLRQVNPKKTVKVLPMMYPVEMYLKNNQSVLKL